MTHTGLVTHVLSALGILLASVAGGCSPSSNPLLPTAAPTGPPVPFLISGIVFGVDGGTRAPLQGAIVETDAAGQTVTDSGGHYELRGVSKLRTLLLKVRKTGYAPAGLTVALTNEMRVDVTLLGALTYGLSGSPAGAADPR